MVSEIDYLAVAEALRACGHDARVEGGGAAPRLISVKIAHGRSMLWDGDVDAWFGSFVAADGDQDPAGGLEITSVTGASSPAEVSAAISAEIAGL